MSIRSILVTILNIVSAIVGITIGLRIIFQLIGASATAPIIVWINNMSESFLYPFRGLFPSFALGPNSVVDVTAIVALLVYAIVFSILYKAVYALTHDHDHGVTEVHSHV